MSLIYLELAALNFLHLQSIIISLHHNHSRLSELVLFSSLLAALVSLRPKKEHFAQRDTFVGRDVFFLFLFPTTAKKKQSGLQGL